MLLVLEVVEDQQCQVVIDAEQQMALVIAARRLLYPFDVGEDVCVDLLHQRHSLEEPVVLFALVVEGVEPVFLEDFLVDGHEGLDVLEVGVLLEDAAQEEQVLDDAATAQLVLGGLVVGLPQLKCEALVAVDVIDDFRLPKHVKLLLHLAHLHGDVVEVALRAQHDVVKILYQVLSLAEDLAQQQHRRIQHLPILVLTHLEQRHHDLIEIFDVPEEVPLDSVAFLVRWG